MLDLNYDPDFLSIIEWRGWPCAIYSPPDGVSTVWDRAATMYQFWLERAKKAIAGRDARS